MRTTRRDFLKAGIAGLVYRAVPQVQPGAAILLKGGRVLSLDPSVGDFDKAGVLIQGSKIVSIQPTIRTSAKVFDAGNMIVMPGFIDTHRHAWEAPLRNILPNGVLGEYTQDITVRARSKDNRLEDKAGTLTPDKEADIIMLRTDQINVMPVNNAYGALVLGMDTSNVDSVFIAGRLMKSHGKLVGIDMPRIPRLLNRSREYIVSKTGLGRG